MNNLQRKFRQWRELAPWERRLFARAIFLLPATWIALRMLGFDRTRSFAERKTSSRPISPKLPDMEFAQRCAELTAIAARNGLYKANCLHQSLVLCLTLRHHGLSARLRIGVLPGSKPFHAHAWVELDDVPLAQQSVVEYEVFERLTAKPEGLPFL